MERDDDPQDGAIDLGAASLATQGMPGLYVEFGWTDDRPPALDAE